MPNRSKWGIKDMFKETFSWNVLKVTFAATKLPRALSEVSHFALSNRKWQFHFEISLNISSENMLVIKRSNKVNGYYSDPIYLDLIWWLTGNSTRLKIRWYPSAELLTSMLHDILEYTFIACIIKHTVTVVKLGSLTIFKYYASDNLVNSYFLQQNSLH